MTDNSHLTPQRPRSRRRRAAAQNAGLIRREGGALARLAQLEDIVLP